jgi:hypothetical protein
MANQWASRARRYYQEYLPAQYAAIPDKETFFRELAQTAAAQIETVYRQIRRPELGDDDPMAMMQAEETVRELLYPPPEPGHEEGWETIEVSTEEYDRLVDERDLPDQPSP